eukprot:TRINITY_DN17750_c0_g1_i3.p1 TRINITY_DN17750_c0_g1~~TRINITY_DN17750_c0_g1_i3.p1  ORF type:complete len:229 (-),score=40.62 TRINITY_DN17750_c0_g1_i3:500-1186(-)
MGDFAPIVELRNPDGSTVLTMQDRVSGLDPEAELVRTIEPAITGSKPQSLVIKTTFGSFANYSNTCLLHAGVTNSAGMVYNFDQAGHHVEQWVEAINVPVEFEDPDAWDAALIGFNEDHKALGVPYQELGYNCYNYIVDFLNAIAYQGRTDHRLVQKIAGADGWWQRGDGGAASAGSACCGCHQRLSAALEEAPRRIRAAGGAQLRALPQGGCVRHVRRRSLWNEAQV